MEFGIHYSFAESQELDIIGRKQKETHSEGCLQKILEVVKQSSDPILLKPEHRGALSLTLSALLADLHI